MNKVTLIGGMGVVVFQFGSVHEHELKRIKQTTLLDPCVRRQQFILGLLVLVEGSFTHHLEHRRRLLDIAALEGQLIPKFTILLLQDQNLAPFDILEDLLHPLQETKQIGRELLILLELARYLCVCV